MQKLASLIVFLAAVHVADVVAAQNTKTLLTSDKFVKVFFDSCFERAKRSVKVGDALRRAGFKLPPKSDYVHIGPHYNLQGAAKDFGVAPGSGYSICLIEGQVSNPEDLHRAVLKTLKRSATSRIIQRPTENYEYATVLRSRHVSLGATVFNRREQRKRNKRNVSLGMKASHNQF